MKRTTSKFINLKIGFLAGVSVWASALAIGFQILLKYSFDPGPSETLSQRLPASSFISLHPAMPTLVMFAHPRCPCSKSSVRELARLLAKHHNQIVAKIYFYQPKGKDESWVRSDLWEEATEIPNASIEIDPEGKEAKALGATVSGQVFFYLSDGRLAFSGGITPGRGHEGESIGKQAIIDSLQKLKMGKKISTLSSPVFGCALMRGDARSAESSPIPRPLKKGIDRESTPVI